jgi:hypothetical protein
MKRIQFGFALCFIMILLSIFLQMDWKQVLQLNNPSLIQMKDLFFRGILCLSN